MQNVILQPIEVGGQTFKNRIMFPPLTTGYEKNGMISEQDMGFYTRLAKGGVGYIVMGDVAPINSFSPTPKLFDDSQIPAFKALADSVHAYGTKLGVQLFHPEYDVDAINSLFMQKKFDEMRQRLHHDMMFFTDEASEEMLMSIIDKMCACAVRAQKAGVDVIQIHGDRLNGCLCSTRMNHRTDKFGGSLENRVRFARMLTRAIRKAVPDMVIDYKLSIVTPQRGKGGIDEADAVQFAQWLVEDGVDMFHVAQANHTGNMADTIPPMGVQPYGFFVKIAGDIKKAVNVPVSAVGRIVDAEMAERVIESGMADMVAVGRPLLADPDWGTKIAAGKACDIRRCISCNKGCTDAIQNRQFLSCVLNAENGYENTRSIQPAAQKKKIAVLGGGPAGLEAARVAALRGHDVTLFEKTTTLGGQLNIACVPPRKEEMRRAAQDLIRAVCNAGVHLCMGQTRTAEQMAAFYKTYLRRGRIKHKADVTAVRRDAKTIGQRFDATLTTLDRRLQVTAFTGDTRDSASLFGKKRFDAIVTDAPYGVAHGSRTDVRGVSGRRDRSAAGLLREAVPVWAGQLMHGGALGLSWNTLGLAREDLAGHLTDAGLVVQEGGAWERFAHRVDSSIRRDLIVAVKP